VSARRALPWLAAVAAVLGAAAIVAWTAFGAGEEPRLEPAGPAPVAGAGWVTPRAHFVADRVEATLDLTVNPALTDPASVEVRAGFRPYTRVAPVEVERVDAADAVLLRYRYALQCIDRACIERVAGATFAFAPAIVQYSSATVGQGTISIEFPEMTVASRLAAGDLAARSFRAGVEAPPELVYAVSPGLMGWLLAGAAAAIVLALGAGAFVLLRRRRSRAVPAEAPAAELAPLPRALARVDAAAGAGEAERRAALDELARALEDGGDPGLAPTARRLAWSRAAPDEDEVRELAAAARNGSEAER
jgi:hypothetical protein